MASDVLRVSGLVRGHLSPDGDHLWAPHQWATYFYANVAPQWETINGGHWKVVENLARKLAGQVSTNLPKNLLSQAFLHHLPYPLAIL